MTVANQTNLHIIESRPAPSARHRVVASIASTVGPATKGKEGGGGKDGRGGATAVGAGCCANDVAVAVTVAADAIVVAGTVVVVVVVVADALFLHTRMLLLTWLYLELLLTRRLRRRPLLYLLYRYSRIETVATCWPGME